MAVELKVGIDVASIRKALGDIVTSSRGANDAMRSHTSKTLKQTTLDYIQAAQKRINADRDAANVKRRLEDEIRAATEKTARSGVEADKQALREKINVMQEALRHVERFQQRESSVREHARQQDLQRQRTWASRGAAIGRTTANAINTGVSIASGVSDEYAQVRQRDRSRDRTMNQAFYQAGAGRADAGALRQRMYDFAAANGMDSGELAQAANATQTEFSVFGNSRSNQQQRSANLEGFLRNALLARNTGQQVSEVTRVAAMLGQSGMNEDAQRRTLLTLTGFAQEGAIELGSVTRTAMAPMQSRIAGAIAGLGAGATEEQRQVAVQQAVSQTFAEMEVGRGLGYSPRVMGQNMAIMGQALHDPTTQAKMLRNIRSRYGANSVQEQVLFEQRRDSQGRMGAQLRSEFQSGLGLSEGLIQAFGGNAQEAMSVLSGGGRRNPQSLQRNWRSIIQAFMGEDIEGVNGAGKIRQMISRAGVAFTQSDVDRGAELFGNDTESSEKRREEQHDAARRGRNGAPPGGVGGFFAGLGQHWENFKASNPITGALASLAPTALTGALTNMGGGAGGLLGRIGLGGVGGVLGRVVPWVGAALMARQGWNMTSEIGDRNTDTTQDERWGTALDINSADRLHDRMVATQRRRVEGVDNQIAMAQGQRFAAITGNNVSDNSLENRLIYDSIVRGMVEAAPRMQLTVNIDPVSMQQNLNQSTSNPPAAPPP